MRRKGDLPAKLCATCARPFTWRKKWERVWDEVRHCSERCRAQRRPVNHPEIVECCGPTSGLVPDKHVSGKQAAVRVRAARSP